MYPDKKARFQPMGESKKPGNPDKENKCAHAAEKGMNSREKNLLRKHEKTPEKLVIFSRDFSQIVLSFFL